MKFFNDRNRPKTGFSMIELVIGIALLSFAIVPLFFLGSRSTRQAFDTKEHIVASEIARAILARYMALDFQKCLQRFSQLEALEASGKIEIPMKLVDDFMFQEILASGLSQDFARDLKRDLRDVRFQVVPKFDKAVDPGEIIITVKVFWPKGLAVDGPISELSVESIKFRENP